MVGEKSPGGKLAIRLADSALRVVRARRLWLHVAGVKTERVAALGCLRQIARVIVTINWLDVDGDRDTVLAVSVQNDYRCSV